MNYKQQLISDLDGLDDSIASEVLDFLHFLKTKQLEDREDIGDARQVLNNIHIEGMIAWSNLKAEVGL